MCIFGNNNQGGSNNLTPAPVAPAPSVGTVTADAASSASDAAKVKTATDAINLNAAIIGKRQGVFGNIKTQPFGDASYGKFTFAKFGSSKAA